MNWDKITTDYPKAEELSDGWADMHTIDWRQSDRWLYDFFDENGLFVLIYFPPTYKKFGWHIHDGSKKAGHTFMGGTAVSDYDSRIEAEEQAFLKAFEILENKLNDNLKINEADIKESSSNQAHR